MMKKLVRHIGRECVRTAEIAAPAVNVLNAVSTAATVGTLALGAPKIVHNVKHMVKHF